MTTDHEVTLCWQDGREATVQTGEEETILDAAESAGISLPRGCVTGACATCVGRLTRGEITYECQPRALKPHQRADGYVLCCIASPRTECRLEVGTAVGTELVEHPWR